MAHGHNKQHNKIRFQIARTLQVNILVAFASLLIITVAVIVGYTYRQNTTAVLRLSDDLIQQVTDNVIERTTNYLAPAATLAQISAQLPNADGTALTDNAELEAYGTRLLRLHPQLSGFFIGNAQGDFLFTKRDVDGSIDTQVIDRALVPPQRTWTYRDADGAVESVDVTTEFTYDPRQRPWYEGAAASQAQYWTDIYIFFTDQKPGITAAYPVLNEAGAVTAVVGIDVALDDLSRFLSTQEVGDSGVAFIINNNADIVAYPGIELAMPEGESFRPLTVSELGVGRVEAAFTKHERTGNGRFLIDHDNARYIASFTRFPAGIGTDWQIGIVVPEDDFIGSIKRTNQISLAISLIILIVAIVSAVLISRSISRPIVQITRETEQIKAFKLDSATEINSPIREVQQLSESITAMRASLRAFKKYVPAELVRRLIQTGEEAQLGGTKRELTILFTDIGGFTAITEGMQPDALMLQLSDYLGALAAVVMDEEGTVDKYVGDGIMAFWGAPLEMPDHAHHACRAALACQARVRELNRKWEAEGKVFFPTRMAIHTGQTLVGNMGSPDRMNYTVVGDSVNLTSRLERANDVYGTQIVVTHDTQEQTAASFYFRPLDVVTVRGKREFILLYELLGERGNASAQVADLADRFTVGYNAYIAQEWHKAHAIFSRLAQDFPHDIPTQIYLSRCMTLRTAPPAPNWRPIVNLETAPLANEMR